MEAALDVFVEQTLLSDERMAEVYVHERLQKGFGPVRIRQELRLRGVSDSLIESHLNRSDGQWMQLIVEVAEKKFGTDPPADRKELSRRARFLDSRGFPAELIARFLHGDDPD